MAGFGDVVNAITGRLPDGRISNEVTVYSQADIDRIQAQLSALPVNGGLSTLVMRQTLTSKLAAARQQLRGQTAGITSAPEKPGQFSNQVQTPLIGLDALTIPI